MNINKLSEIIASFLVSANTSKHYVKSMWFMKDSRANTVKNLCTTTKSTWCRKRNGFYNKTADLLQWCLINHTNKSHNPWIYFLTLIRNKVLEYNSCYITMKKLKWNNYRFNSWKCLKWFSKSLIFCRKRNLDHIKS